MLYGKLTVAIVSALIGTFVAPILVLVFTDGLTFEQIGYDVMGGATLFAVLGFLFPKPMGKVLFVLILFQ